MALFGDRLTLFEAQRKSVELMAYLARNDIQLQPVEDDNGNGNHMEENGNT
ncbi:MAG: hypothetical protein QOJ19_616 [Acidimicrobiia bacterium]|nr:hypothetical protein [Acidimicrobiia bacterium]